MLNGKYTAKAMSASLGLTSTNKEQVGVLFEIIEGESAGQTITWYGYFTDATMTRTIESLRVAGWTGDDFADLSEIDGVNTPAVQLVIEQEEYNGAWNAKVRWVNRLGSSGVAMNAPLDGAAAQSFAARMKNKVRAFDASQKQGQPKAAASARPAPQQQRKPTGPASPEPPPPGFEDEPPGW